MTERLLQFIWQFQYFNKGHLLTSGGQTIQVIFPGQPNYNQGPDFLNAKIIIGKTTWAGTIEIHNKTSDWYKHKHQHDKNYSNVILHVVWEDDGNQEPVPVFELSSRVSKILLQKYTDLMQSEAFIPCENSIQVVPEIIWQSWKTRLLAERLLRKSGIVEEYLKQNNYHWEETFWWLLARNFGMKVNADAFEAMARTIPLHVLSKHRSQIHQLEALLLGQAGLLKEDFESHYPKLLKKEYNFFQNKYDMKPIQLPLFTLRMRPENFPAIRLAELAMLVHVSAHLFSKIKEAQSTLEIKELFRVTANDYWHYHYQLDESAIFKEKKTGVSMIDNIIINTVAPMLFAYGSYLKEDKYRDKALRCLEEAGAEKNLITKGFVQLKVENKNAWDSQALIELKNEYCTKRRCLDCSIGNNILKT